MSATFMPAASWSSATTRPASPGRRARGYRTPWPTARSASPPKAVHERAVAAVRGRGMRVLVGRRVLRAAVACSAAAGRARELRDARGERTSTDGQSSRDASARRVPRRAPPVSIFCAAVPAPRSALRGIARIILPCSFAPARGSAPRGPQERCLEPRRRRLGGARRALPARRPRRRSAPPSPPVATAQAQRPPAPAPAPCRHARSPRRRPGRRIRRRCSSPQGDQRRFTRRVLYTWTDARADRGAAAHPRPARAPSRRSQRPLVLRPGHGRPALSGDRSRAAALPGLPKARLPGRGVGHGAWAGRARSTAAS